MKGLTGVLDDLKKKHGSSADMKGQIVGNRYQAADAIKGLEEAIAHLKEKSEIADDGPTEENKEAKPEGEGDKAEKNENGDEEKEGGEEGDENKEGEGNDMEGKTENPHPTGEGDDFDYKGW